MKHTMRLLFCIVFALLLWGCAVSGPALSMEEPVASLSPVPTPSASPTPVPTVAPTPTPDPAMAPYTIAWMSDTQGYCAAHPETFRQMTQWIVDNREAEHIQYVVHTGDIVNDPRDDRQWDRAETALDPLIGRIPLFAVAGNHDIAGTVRMYQPFANIMEKHNPAQYPTFGGMDAKWRRRYDLITIGHEDFILIGAGYVLNRSDFEWMNDLLAQYSDRTAILIVHWYTEKDGSLGNGDGWNVYRNVVCKNANIKYVLCGHRHHVRMDQQQIDLDGDRSPDNTVYALQGDYETVGEGWEGYLTLLTFDHVAREIRVRAYSPLLGWGDERPEEGIASYTLPLNTVTH